MTSSTFIIVRSTRLHPPLHPDMVLILLAALSMAVLFLLFKVFDKRNIPLLPAIVINYFVAFTCGSMVAPPWAVGDLTPLTLPALVLGILFITIFYMTGVSTQRAGVAATSVASKMSLVLTVAVAVVLYDEEPGLLGWSGILLALVGVVLASWTNGPAGARGMWILPALLFLGNASIDILLNATQREVLTPATEPVLPTLIFGVAGVLGSIRLITGPGGSQIRDPRVWVAGLLLGSVNYASLYFIVGSLARSGYPASSVFPLMNIGVILFGILASIVVFQERLSRIQWWGIGCSIAALALILWS
jgi:drug/metabolite transporter (DMT)-like permease